MLAQITSSMSGSLDLSFEVERVPATASCTPSRETALTGAINVGATLSALIRQTYLAWKPISRSGCAIQQVDDAHLSLAAKGVPGRRPGPPWHAATAIRIAVESRGE